MVFRNSVLLLLVHGALAGGDGAGDDHSACVCNSAGYIVCENKGRIYSGQCEGDNREGYGVHQLADGARYEGEFSNGFIAGLGLNVLVDGSELRGMFSNGKLDGHGVYTWVNGQVYEGEWSAGKRSGFGKLTYNAELSFEGEWEADEMAGMGVLDASGSTITGVFKGDDIEEELDALPADVAAKLASAVGQGRSAAERALASSRRAQEQSEIAWGYSSNSSEVGALPPPSKPVAKDTRSSGLGSTSRSGEAKPTKQRSGFGASAEDEDESNFMASWEKDEF